MLDLARVHGFDWDKGNARKNIEKHGVSQEEAEQVFADASLLVSDDVRHTQSEERFQALGQSLEGRALHVTFTLRDNGKKIRIISARDMNRKERRHYDEEA